MHPAATHLRELLHQPFPDELQALALVRLQCLQRRYITLLATQASSCQQSLRPSPRNPSWLHAPWQSSGTPRVPSQAPLATDAPTGGRPLPSPRRQRPPAWPAPHAAAAPPGRHPALAGTQAALHAQRWQEAAPVQPDANAAAVVEPAAWCSACLDGGRAGLGGVPDSKYAQVRQQCCAGAHVPACPPRCLAGPTCAPRCESCASRNRGIPVPWILRALHAPW